MYYSNQNSIYFNGNSTHTHMIGVIQVRVQLENTTIIIVYGFMCLNKTSSETYSL